MQDNVKLQQKSFIVEQILKNKIWVLLLGKNLLMVKLRNQMLQANTY